MVNNNESNEKTSSPTTRQAPIAKFAILTDVQYADVDDAMSFDKKMRYYRNSVNLVREAVETWRKESSNDDDLSFKFLIQLGDLIDGKCVPMGDSTRAMNLIIDELKALYRDCEPPADDSSVDRRVLHVWGNHEFYNFTRKQLVNTPLNTARDLNQNQGFNFFF